MLGIGYWPVSSLNFGGTMQPPTQTFPPVPNGLGTPDDTAHSGTNDFALIVVQPERGRRLSVLARNVKEGNQTKAEIFLPTSNLQDV